MLHHLRATTPPRANLILAQHGLTEVTEADRQRHDLELGVLMLAVFSRHFEVPTLPTDVDVFALALELSDRLYARSVHQHGLITPRMAEEGMRVCLMRMWGVFTGVFCLSAEPWGWAGRASWGQVESSHRTLPHIDL